MHWVISVYCLAGFLISLAESQCESGWQSYDGKCYFISGSELNQFTWQAARSYCLDHGGELASIHSQAEMDFILDQSESMNYDGFLWTGLNQFENRDESHKWSDGSAVSFTDWASDQPNEGGLEKCAYTRTTDKDEGCYDRFEKISVVDGIIDNPRDLPDGCTATYMPTDYIPQCEQLCYGFENCYAYTFYSNAHPDFTWKGECLACIKDVVGDNWVESEYATTGVQISCGTPRTRLWHTDNCGRKYGFVCKKDPGSSGPATVPPTPEAPGYCPKDFFGIGNKCYKLVDMPYPSGISWDEARERCMQEPGIEPDLASISSEYEQAIVTASMTSVTWGYWIGLRKINLEYLWYDNSDTSYTNWNEGQPFYFDCGEMLSYGGPVGSWNALNCDNKRGYVCQTYKVEVGGLLDRDISNVISTPSVDNPNNCDDGFQSYWYGCYKFEDSHKTWSEARDYCRTLNSEVASLHDEPENAYLLAISYSQTPIWLGFQQVDGEYKWLDDWPILFTNWGANEPENGEGCVAMESDGKWDDTICNNQYAFVCKQAKVDPPTTPAPSEGFCPNEAWEEWVEYCYYFSGSESDSWDQALVKCAQLAGSDHYGSLASIHDRVTNDWLYNNAKDGERDGIWIGLRKYGANDPFEWSDKSTANYFRWAPGEPNDGDGTELCVEMHTSSWPGMWNDYNCSMPRPFFCKAEKAQRKLITIPEQESKGSESNNPGSSLPDQNMASIQADHLSSGSVAGIVLGILFSVLVVSLLAGFAYHRKLPNMSRLFSKKEDMKNIMKESTCQELHI